MKLRHQRHPRRRAPVITSIARLRLNPDDVLVLHVPRESLRSAFDMASGLRQQLGRKVIVLGPGMRFGIVQVREAATIEEARAMTGVMP